MNNVVYLFLLENNRYNHSSTWIWRIDLAIIASRHDSRPSYRSKIKEREKTKNTFFDAKRMIRKMIPTTLWLYFQN